MARNIVVSNMSFCIQLRKINRSFYYCYYFELEFATVLPQCVNKIIVSIHRSWFSMIKLHFFVRLFGLLLVKSDSDFNYVLLKWESVKKKYQMYTFQFIKQECIDQNNNRIYEIIHFSSHQQKRSTIQFLNSRMMSCFIWTHILNIYIVLLLFFSHSVSYMLNGIKCG